MKYENTYHTKYITITVIDFKIRTFLCFCSIRKSVIFLNHVTVSCEQTWQNRMIVRSAASASPLWKNTSSISRSSTQRISISAPCATRCSAAPPCWKSTGPPTLGANHFPVSSATSPTRWEWVQGWDVVFRENQTRIHTWKNVKALKSEWSETILFSL